MPAVQVQRTQASLTDPDLATRQTVAKMCEHIRNGARDPLVQRLARQLTGPTQAQTAENIWKWVKTHCKFVRDEHQAAAFGIFDNLDFLIEPAVMIRCDPPKGDCDDFTMLTDALLSACGIAWELVALKCDARDPGRDSHIFSRAIIGGNRLSMDAIPPATYCGWQVPAAHTFGMKTFGPNGAQTMTSGFSGFHGYTLRGMGACGDCLEYDDNGNCTQTDQSDCATGGSSSGSLFPYTTPVTTPPITGSPTQSPTSATNSPFANFAASLASSWTKIAGQVIAPQTTVLKTAQGTSITGPAASISSIFGGGGLSTLATVGSGNGIVVIGGLALAGLLIFSLAKGK